MPTHKEIEAQVRADYDAAVGRIVFLTEVECYDAKDDSETVVCDPPAIARVDSYSERDIRESLLRWTSDSQCDPYLNITILEPHPAFADVRPSWIYGKCRNTDGTVEEPYSYEIADEATQEKYRDVQGLDHETNGGCAPSAASPAP